MPGRAETPTSRFLHRFLTGWRPSTPPRRVLGCADVLDSTTRRSRSATSRSGTAPCSRSITSTSRSAPARSAGCSARTARARRRRCGCSSGSSIPTAARRGSSASTCGRGRRELRRVGTMIEHAVVRAPPHRHRQPQGSTGRRAATASPMPTSTARSPSPGSATRSTARSRRTPRACASASASPARCSAGPSCSCSTSRRTVSTRRRCAPCASCCGASARKAAPSCCRATSSPRSSRSARHAVVMDRGKLVATGTVRRARGLGRVRVRRGRRHRPRAHACSRRCREWSGSLDESPGLVVRLAGATARSSSPRWWRAGIGVQTVTSRHALEEAFLGLVGEETERHVGKGA